MHLPVAIVVCTIFLQVTNAENIENNLLIDAVKQKKTEIISWLLSEDVDRNVRDELGKTALMHASHNSESDDIIGILLRAGANADLKDDHGKTALQHAVEAGSLNKVTILFSQMNNTNVFDNEGRNALHSAVTLTNHSDIFLDFFLAKGLDPTSKDIYGYTPVHTAALLGNIVAIKKFIDYKIDVNLTSSKGETPLMIASLFSQFQAVKFLLNSEAEINGKDYKNNTALHSAASTGFLQMVTWLVENNSILDIANSDGYTPLYIAVEKGFLDVAQYLINKGSDITVKDNNGNTLMHAAAKSGNVELINYLIENKIGINDVNNEGVSPILVATQEGQAEAVTNLIKNGADTAPIKKLGLSLLKTIIFKNYTEVIKPVIEIEDTFVSNMTDVNGETLLHIASKHSNKDMVNYILELLVAEIERLQKAEKNYKINPRIGICLQCITRVTNLKNSEGKTALYIAAENGNYEAIEVLMHFGAFQEISDNVGMTPFHVAASLGYTNILKELFAHMNNLEAVNDNGKTALFLATEGGHLDTVKYLLHCGAQYETKDSKGMSLLHVAALKGYTALMQDLLTINQLKSKLNEDKDYEGKTPTWYAINNGHLDMLPVFEHHGVQIDKNDICQIVKNGHYNIIKNDVLQNLLLENSTDTSSLLHSSASKGLTNVVEILSKYSCFLNSLDKENRSALWYAVEAEKWASVEKIEQEGGKLFPNVTIIEAVKNNQIGFVKYLVRKGTSVESEDDGGWPILFLAALHGYNEIVRFLLDSGANVSSKTTGWRWTPVHGAAWVGHCKTVELLMSHGANADATNSFNFNAKEQGKPSCQEALRKGMNTHY